jgi:hypothetical protein
MTDWTLGLTSAAGSFARESPGDAGEDGIGWACPVVGESIAATVSAVTATHLRERIT